MSYKKDGVLVFHQFLNDYAKKDMGSLFQITRFLGTWLMEQPYENKGEGAYFVLVTEINKLLIKFENGDGFDTYDYSLLLYTMEEISEEWLNEIDVKLYLDYGHPRPNKLPIKGGAAFTSVTESASNVKLTDGDTINVLYTNGDSSLCTDGEKVDIFLTGEDLESATEYCVEFSTYDHDMAFLRGKLQSIALENNDTQLLLTGTLHACAGVLEGDMGRLALCLAVGTQDPYYVMRGVTEAKKKCRAVSAAVIIAPYHFWYMDLNAAETGFTREALERTCAPVLGRRGMKTNEPHPPYRVKHRMPLIERVFDLQFIMDSHSKNLSAVSARISYYHNQYNQRPVTGNLSYRFTQMNEDENRSAAAKLAGKYRELVNEDQLKRNLEEFRAFLDKMARRKVKIYVVIPPATGMLRDAGSAKPYDSLIEAMLSLNNENFVYKDYYESAEFQDRDFQDYDHLNERGAEKFTKMINDLLT